MPCTFKAKADYSDPVLSCKERVSGYTACNVTTALVGMTGECAVQHSQGQAGATRPCVQEQEQGADQEL